MRAIDADELEGTYKNRLGLVMERYGIESSEAGILGGAIKLLKTQPTITPERKRGRWETYIISMIDGEGCRCSECGFEGVPYWEFCPNCGADMEGE